MHDQDTGTLLRRLRLERGWTQRQAAELLGVSAQAVSKWERGQGCPDVGMLPRLAKIFGVSRWTPVCPGRKGSPINPFSAWREFWTETCFRRRRMEEI